jgi:hypothetical protein
MLAGIFLGALIVLAFSLIAPFLTWRQTKSMDRAIRVWKSWAEYMAILAAFTAVCWFFAWLSS